MTNLVGGLLDAVRRVFSAREPAVAPLDFGYADLRGGGSRIAVIPRLGGRISALELGGREWLSTLRVTSLPDAGHLADEADGFDEYFPTVSACTVPSYVRGFGGTSLPERGELCTQTPAFEVRTEGRPAAITTWTGARMPYELRRTIRVNGDASVACEYVVTNMGKDPMPFVWSAKPVFPLTPKTRVVLPEGILARVGAQHGVDLGGGAREQRWPRFRLGDRLVDMSRPDSVASRYACKLFFDMPREPIALEEDDLRLEIWCDPLDVPNLGLWINKGALPVGKRSAARVLALQPAIGAPDSLAEALGDWKSACWLAPNAAREWRLTFRARPLTSETRAARETPAGSRQQSR